MDRFNLVQVIENVVDRQGFEPSVQVLTRTTVWQKDRSRRSHSFSRAYSRTRGLQVEIEASHLAGIVSTLCSLCVSPRSVYVARREGTLRAFPEVDSCFTGQKRLTRSLPVGARRHSHDGSEHLAEIALTAKPN